MDAPAKLDITIYQGRDFSLYIGLRTDEDVPIDLSSHTIKAQIRAQKSLSSRLIAEFSIDETSKAAGDLVLSLTDAQTAAAGDLSGWWDLATRTTAGVDETWLGGKVTVEGSVTDNG